MSSDRDSGGPPNSEPEDSVYVENEEGEPRMAGRPESFRERYWSRSSGPVSPRVYMTAIVAGVVMLLLPEPITSTVGFVLVLVGLFLGVVDVLSPG